MAVIYLDPETEITAAVARLRAMRDAAVVLVVPAGSRIGTSRINFRLLAREARERGLRLATVSGDPPVRALSDAAGVPAYGSVDAAEAALSEVPTAPAAAPAAGPATAERPSVSEPSGPPSPPVRSVPSDRAARVDQTRVLPGRRSVEPPLYEPEVAPKRRRRVRWIAPLVVLALLASLVGLGAYAAYLLLPTAEITLRPRLIDVGPLSMTVVADPTVAAVDPAARLVPAQLVELPVTVKGEFTATGTRVTATHASGRVRFRSENTVFDVPIPAGTAVSTPDGVEFETTASVTVPRAVFNVRAGTATVEVRAVRPGPSGNVAAGRIRRLPESLAAALVSVRNPQRTAGGRQIEEPIVTHEDVDAAVTALTVQLAPELAAVLRDSASTPRGLTLYRGSAQLGPAVPDPPASELIDSTVESFTLSLSATARVLGVNEQLVDDVAAQQLRQRVPAGTVLLDSTVTTAHAPGIVRGRVVEFTATAVARSYRLPDRDELLAEVRGESLSRARAIMEKYGSVDIVIWPEFVDRVPDQVARINLIVQPPVENP
ncbi:MAG: baseplate J/gp47 family protein [Chloroflexota bacterium]|nr:baseplate J/gp47 family protein [Chloroflexota bacterium]